MDTFAKVITAYADGSCDPTTNLCTWGVMTKHGTRETKYSGTCKHATDANHAELEAVLKAIEYCRGIDSRIQIYTDSMYVVDRLKRWLDNPGGFRSSVVWRRMESAMGGNREVEVIWAKRGSHPFLIEAHRLAYRKMQRVRVFT